jgi:AraC family transcriptional regulator of adaptative response/methylated-DNA-[protein]-cysteine methyltransferase
MTGDRSTQPPVRESAADPAVDLARRACAYLDAQEGRPVTLAELGRALEVSPWHLQRMFKKVIGISPREYADARRLTHFRRELQDGESVAAVSRDGSASRGAWESGRAASNAGDWRSAVPRTGPRPAPPAAPVAARV